MSEEPEINPMMSPKRDLKRLGKNSQAVVGELREFLATLKGKSPKEMMGSVANSSLTQSMLVATGITVFLLVTLTAIPYALKVGESTARHLKLDSPSKGEKASPEAEHKGNKPDATPSDKPSSPEQSTADKLGIGEEKTTDPNSNPLDSKDNDLLDGLDDL